MAIFKPHRNVETGDHKPTTTAVGAIRMVQGRVRVWILSIVCVIFLPCFPLLVEGYKTNWSIGRESVLLTAAVLASGYLISSRTNLPRAMYIVVFLVSVAYDFGNYILDNGRGMSDSVTGQAGTTEITGEKLEVFYRLFYDWAAEWPNSEALELGGLGEWASLAQRCYEWAKES